MFMIFIFFLSKMVKQKLLENKRNVLKVRRIKRNVLTIGNMSNSNRNIVINIFTIKTTV